MMGALKKRRSKAAYGLVAALSLAVGLTVIDRREALAQGGFEPVTVVAPSTFQIAPNSEAPLRIQITPAGATPGKTIVLIRGLPSSIALSTGRLFESGTWGVAATDLAGLKISSTSAAVGRTDITISLVSLDGTLLAEARSSLLVGQPAPAAKASAPIDDKTVLTAATPAPEPAAPKRLSAQQAEQLLSLVRKGDEQMRHGDVSAARLLYRHAAESGLAAGAFALAGTFDGEELSKHQVLGGVQPDPKEAQAWYRKAHELGSPEARERLQRLGAR